MKLKLRKYQQDAINANYQHYAEKTGENSCIVIPTGGGKSKIITRVCEDFVSWGCRVLVVSHVKELLSQLEQHLKAEQVDVGVYSAGLSQRDVGNAVIVGGIQSICKRGFELCGDHAFDLCLIDEAHRIPTEGEGQYVQLLQDLQSANPSIAITGLTATPFRTNGGYICTPDHFINKVVYEADVKELTEAGYLSPLTSKHGRVEADMKGCKKSGGDFNQADMQERFMANELVLKACLELHWLTGNCKKVLIFACGLAHADMVAHELQLLGESPVIVSSKHPDRDKNLRAFREDDDCKYLINMNVLTTGFDQSDIDCVALMRATISPGLYVQMCGRGMRIDPNKAGCLVLDYGGNVARHGTLNKLKIAKGKDEEDEEESVLSEPTVLSCPECLSLFDAPAAYCPDCGFVFPVPDVVPTHEEKAGDRGPMDEQEIETIDTEVGIVSYAVHTKKGAGPEIPKTLRVTYLDMMSQPICSEWVCIEHKGFARGKASVWWSCRTTMPMPSSVQDAIDLIKEHGIQEPSRITVAFGAQFPEIKKYRLEPIVVPVQYEDDEIPF
jgi:DNA repair protein RadD